jgi:hypothetical protein
MESSLTVSKPAVRSTVTLQSKEGDQERHRNLTTTSQPPDGSVTAFHLSGWRVGAVCAAICGFISLAVNCGVAGWLFMRHAHSIDARVVVLQGSCRKVRNLNLWVHLAINALSTLLLGGSNYCMQCLVAPTRGEIDKAHRIGRWLDIGVPSLRNLRFMTMQNQILWTMLALTTLPIHLMCVPSAEKTGRFTNSDRYNSAFYSSIGTTSYEIIFATEDFIQGAKPNLAYPRPPQYGLDDDFSRIQADVVSWDRFSNLECIQVYATDLQTEKRNVVVVTSNRTENGSSILDYRWCDWYSNIINSYNPYSW